MKQSYFNLIYACEKAFLNLLNAALDNIFNNHLKQIIGLGEWASAQKPNITNCSIPSVEPRMAL